MASVKFPIRCFGNAIGIAASMRPAVSFVLDRYAFYSVLLQEGEGRQFKSMTIRTLHMNALLYPSSTSEVEIITTSHGCMLLVVREGVPMAEGFLPCIEQGEPQ